MAAYLGAVGINCTVEIYDDATSRSIIINGQAQQLCPRENCGHSAAAQAASRHSASKSANHFFMWNLPQSIKSTY